MTTVTVQASELLEGDRIGDLPSDRVLSVNSYANVTVVVIESPHGFSISELASDSPVKIVARSVDQSQSPAA